MRKCKSKHTLTTQPEGRGALNVHGDDFVVCTIKIGKQSRPNWLQML